VTEEFVRTLGVGVVTFVGTNIDDLFLLALLFSNRSFPPTQVVLGQFLGISLIIGVSYASSLVGSLVIPQGYLRMLGLIPVLFGLLKLVDLWKKKVPDREKIQMPVKKSRTLSLAVAALTFAAGGDNIAVYIPLFANLTSIKLGLIISVYLIMTGLWCALALYLVSRKKIEFYLNQTSRIIFPFVWIAVGVSILFLKNEVLSSP